MNSLRRNLLPVALITMLLFLLLSSACNKNNVPAIEKRDCNTRVPMRDTVVLLVMGQSNAANAGKVLYTAHCNNTFNFYGGSLYALNDPLKGANGTGGSVWGRLADKLIERNFAATVIVVPCAIGGTKIEQWVPGGEYNHLISETIQYLNSAGLKPTHVLWHQGESNHVAFSNGLSAQQNADNYTANFDLLVNYLRAQGIAAPIYPAITTICMGAPDAALENAQRNLANAGRQIFNGPNTDTLGSEFRYDNCHFNEAGLNQHADRWADILMQ